MSKDEISKAQQHNAKQGLTIWIATRSEQEKSTPSSDYGTSSTSSNTIRWASATPTPTRPGKHQVTLRNNSNKHSELPAVPAESHCTGREHEPIMRHIGVQQTQHDNTITLNRKTFSVEPKTAHQRNTRCKQTLMFDVSRPDFRYQQTMPTLGQDLYAQEEIKTRLPNAFAFSSPKEQDLQNPNGQLLCYLFRARNKFDLTKPHVNKVQPAGILTNAHTEGSFSPHWSTITQQLQLLMTIEFTYHSMQFARVVRGLKYSPRYFGNRNPGCSFLFLFHFCINKIAHNFHLKVFLLCFRNPFLRY